MPVYNLLPMKRDVVFIDRSRSLLRFLSNPSLLIKTTPEGYLFKEIVSFFVIFLYY